MLCFFLLSFQRIRPPRRSVHSTLDYPGDIQQACRWRFLCPIWCSRVNRASSPQEKYSGSDGLRVTRAWGVVPILLSEISPPAFRSTFPGVAYQLGNMVSSASAQIEASQCSPSQHSCCVCSSLLSFSWWTTRPDNHQRRRRAKLCPHPGYLHRSCIRLRHRPRPHWSREPRKPL